ncbi:MAG: DNA replication and repair protein RecF [Gemmatimonadaceae bacterium]|nr:DNA replication and repair protein RecF [Gemmatimonadaceae bacterium]
MSTTVAPAAGDTVAHDATDARAVRLGRLTLTGFRNYGRAVLDMPPDGAALLGDNGHGKTNLLEAIYYLELFRSARGARDRDLVQFGGAGFHVSATLEGSPRGALGVSAGFDMATQRKKVMLDGVEVTRLSDAIGAAPAVLFSPADVALVRGAPSERRRFLDVMLALADRGYLLALQRYRHALAQRNAALRTLAGHARDAGALDGVAAFEPAMAEAGATMLVKRHTWALAAAPVYEEMLQSIGERTTVSLTLKRGGGARTDEAELAAWLAGTLEQQRVHDVRRGTTHTGPHRDEVQLLLDHRDLRSFGSNGQQRSAAIALRMLEARTLHTALGTAPLLLLDDPFAELDADRSARILGLLGSRGLGQVVLAVPRSEDIPRALTGLQTVHVQHGTLRVGP